MRLIHVLLGSDILDTSLLFARDNVNCNIILDGIDTFHGLVMIAATASFTIKYYAKATVMFEG